VIYHRVQSLCHSSRFMWGFALWGRNPGGRAFREPVRDAVTRRVTWLMEEYVWDAWND